jgi:(S)-ureidoglycine aminohydrolase
MNNTDSNLQQELFGTTRTVVAARHALISPDGHVPSTFPGWEGATAYIMLSPGMGAKLTQMLITFEDTDSVQAVFPADIHEHTIYIESGECDVNILEDTMSLKAGDYIFVPPHTALLLQGSPDAKVTVFRKQFEAIEGIDVPPFVHGSSGDVKGEPFLGNPKAILQTLLPIDPRFDLAMNIFTYESGATLPFVETHIMEHGLLMLSGQGIYRLEDAYYPVAAGDAIWMAPYCPQWFVAMGDEPASYLYYKDVHRLP